jgi:nucleotide sugar dehydrogenase
MNISIIGLGFVGGSMYKSFKLKGVNVKGYDKFKESDTFEDTIKSEIIFLCLPTQFNESTKEYEKSIIYDTCDLLVQNNYQGIVVIKSTVEPTTTDKLAEKYNLKFVHNPEFLTARTAFEDFHSQKHIVLGKSKNVNDEEIKILERFYRENYINADISICTCLESESMKIFCNTFYSVKIQFFNELYLLCNKMNCDYNNVVELMLKNGWINRMHTNVPGPDGKLSYGGLCFPKDTNALLNFMKINNSECDVLEATVNERNKMRNDDDNIIKK